MKRQTKHLSLNPSPSSVINYVFKKSLHPWIHALIYACIWIRVYDCKAVSIGVMSIHRWFILALSVKWEYFQNIAVSVLMCGWTTLIFYEITTEKNVWAELSNHVAYFFEEILEVAYYKTVVIHLLTSTWVGWCGKKHILHLCRRVRPH